MARSQLLMLQAIQRQHPELPTYLYRLSRSSFYLYLAQQCDAAGNARATLSWLGQAIAVDPITPFARLGFYLLLFKSLGRHVKGFWRDAGENQAVSPRLGYAGQPCRMTQEEKTPINPFKIQLKVVVGTLLHHTLSHL
jgi:hypothetical protein